jgi:hypothetical protein
LALRAVVSSLVAVVAASGAAGCGQQCCTVDGFPILMERAPLGATVPAAVPDTGGGLLARATSSSVAGGAPFSMVVDTAAPVTVFDGPVSRTLVSRTFQLHDATAAAPLRADFQGINTIQLPLGPVGDATVKPLGVLGGDLLRGYSVEMRLGAPCPSGLAATAPSPLCPSVTFWKHQGGNEGFFQDAGYAVLRFSAYGGGEINVQGDRDLFGLRAPVSLPPTRILVRTCAAPTSFVPAIKPQACCNRTEEVAVATGADLSLVLATGVGPVVLSQSAWARVASKLDTQPAMLEAPLRIATWPTTIPAVWTTLPRVALVNLEAGVNDPGPCAELARSRRLEWVSYQQVMGPEFGACAQPCDTDPREKDKAQNSAAYIEIGGQVPIAIIADNEPLLQGIRVDVRPEGPEIDGLLGAAGLGLSRLEIDYRNNPTRLIFSCESDSPRDRCWTAARCPRLPDREHKHLCFGLPAHQLPQTCAPSECPVQ